MKGKRAWNVASRLKSNLACAERMGGIVGSSSDTTRSATNRDASFVGTQRQRILTTANVTRNGRKMRISSCAKKSTVLRCSKRSLGPPSHFAACYRKWQRWRPPILLSSYWAKPELERNLSPAPYINAPTARNVLLFV